MNIEDLRDFCLEVKGATESLPFLDETTLVFKVMGKMFAYINTAPKDGNFHVNLKCDPEKSLTLRDTYTGIATCTHTRSPSWNAVYLDSDVPDPLIRELIRHSVEEVIKKLPKKKQEEYTRQITE